MVDPAFDVRSLAPAATPDASPVPTVRSPLRLPASLPAGDYDVFVSIGSAAGTPEVALPHDGDDGRERLRTGAVRIAARRVPETAR